MPDFLSPIRIPLLSRAMFLLTLLVGGDLLAQEPNADPVSQPGLEILNSVGVARDLLQDARNGTLEAFTNNEFYLFEGMLEAISELEKTPPKLPPVRFQLVEALQSPSTYRGSFVQLKGTIRRISPIKISSDKLRERLGREQYYHVDFFVSTNKTNFHLQDAEGQIVIGGTFGVTLILLDLPEDWQGIESHTDVTIPGFFLKNWSHKTAESRGVSSELRRPNPIIFGIASGARVPDFSQAGVGVGPLIRWGLGGLLLILALFGGWQWKASQRRNRVAIEYPAQIDFSNLDRPSD